MSFTEQEKVELIFNAFQTSEGRVALAQAMAESIKRAEIEEIDRFELMDFE
jgi:hypothetical protein